VVAPAIQVLGAYRVPFTEALLRKAMELKYGYISPEDGEALSEARAQLNEELSSIALIEVLVRNPDDRFDVGGFGQSHMGQVAYDEVYLSSDGTRV
jgi:hypothetical protein